MRQLLSVLGLLGAAGCCTGLAGKVRCGNAWLCPEDVCTGLEKNGCAPTVDRPLVFNKTQPILPVVTGSQAPQWLDWIGRVKAIDDNTGSEPSVCGRDALTPFSREDLEEVANQTIDYKYNLSREFNVGGGIDFIAIARAAGAKEADVKNLAADVEASWESGLDREISTKAKFVAVRIKQRAMDQLRAEYPESRLTRCVAHLNKRSVRLVKAISGFLVTESTQTDAVVDEIVAGVKTRVAGKASNDTIAKLEALLKSKGRERLATAMSPRLSILAATFYAP